MGSEETMNAIEPYHATVTLEVDFPAGATAEDIHEAITSAAGMASVAIGNRQDEVAGLLSVDSGRAAGTRVRYRVEP